MLITKLIGGLGNQLFQIFTLMSVSIDNDIDFKIFEYKDDKVSPHDINSKRNTFWDTLFKNIYDKTFKSISGPIYQYNENGFHYTPFPKIRDKSNNYSLFGYFQSYKYFQNNLKDILDLLKWREIKKPYENKYDYKNTISLHFRIGDYINIQTHHPILPIDYYKNALDRLIVDTDKNDWNILYFYEKNDKDIVDRSINELKNKYPNLDFTEINHDLDDWEQMICMTFCSHNIIANSTFSWWGAYLNENNNHVYYPDVWFGSDMGNKNLNDLFLNDWQKVTCRESKKTGITILMPIYNGIEFIEESVSSIIKQTYTDWELIIGINGHPPDSEIYKKAKEYSSDKIKVHDLIDIKGKSSALNEMLKYSNFKWISLLDVDDIWLSNKLESHIPYMKSYDIIGTQCEYFGDITGSPNIPLRDIAHFDFYKTNPVINSSCLVKKELCYWNGEFNGVEDYDMWLRLWKQNYKFYNVETIQVLHRIHKQSAFNNTNNNRVEKLINYHKSQ